MVHGGGTAGCWHPDVGPPPFGLRAATRRRPGGKAEHDHGGGPRPDLSGSSPDIPGSWAQQSAGPRERSRVPRGARSRGRAKGEPASCSLGGDYRRGRSANSGGRIEKTPGQRQGGRGSRRRPDVSPNHCSPQARQGEERMRALAPWESLGLAALQPRPLAGGERGKPEGPRRVDSALPQGAAGTPKRNRRRQKAPYATCPKAPRREVSG